MGKNSLPIALLLEMRGYKNHAEAFLSAIYGLHFSVLCLLNDASDRPHSGYVHQYAGLDRDGQPAL